MRVLLTGATGFIGHALTMRLQRDGHQVMAWVRSPGKARARLGAETLLVDAAGGAGALAAAVGEADAVVSLAGEPVIGRWTETKKRAIHKSRLDITSELVTAMKAAPKKPRVFVSSSAVGIYGDGSEPVDESSPAGSGFLAEVCTAWEAAAREAEGLGVRTVIVRTGVVLGLGGGALAQMLPLFRLGVGGRLGSGKQWQSWIHLDDEVEIFARAITDEGMTGVYNGTAPTPVTNRELTRALAAAVGKPAPFPVPSLALKALFGGGASAVLGGQRVLPKRLEAHGFRWRFRELEPALRELVGSVRSVDIQAAREVPDVDYVKRRGVRHVLVQRAVLDQPIDVVFDFFSRAENLGAITPPDMTFSIETPTPVEMKVGQVIDYTIRVGPLPLKWRTVIEVWKPGEMFVDSMARGPYRAWWHEHHFTRVGARTLMEDRVFYSVPLGPLGWLANWVFVAGKLRGIFGYRTQVIGLRFGLVDEGAGVGGEAAGARAERVTGV